MASNSWAQAGLPLEHVGVHWCLELSVSINVWPNGYHSFLDNYELPKRLVSALTDTSMNGKTTPHPFVKWAGGKRQLIESIKKRMPQSFGRYFEPFVGGGALFFELKPNDAVINDINEALISCYRTISLDSEAFMTELDGLDSGIGDDPKPYYYEVRERFNSKLAAREYDCECAALLVFLNKHCFNGLYRVNSKGGFNVPCNGSKTRSYDRQNIEDVAEALTDVAILNGDFAEACADAKKGDFVFLDSPYAPLNPTSFESYTKEGFSLDDHKRLAALFDELTSRGCYCILTNHNTDLINELYADYKIDVVQVRRFINSDASNRKGTEVIIRNF